MKESRQDQLINCTEAYLENHVEKLLKDDDCIEKIDEKYNLKLDDEERQFIKELFVSHLILDIF